MVISRAPNALDGNLHPCFHDQSRSLTDHPCNGTSGAPYPGEIRANQLLGPQCGSHCPAPESFIYALLTFPLGLEFIVLKDPSGSLQFGRL